MENEAIPRAYLHFPHTLDPAHWSREYEAGRVPDRLPYGLNRLVDFGVEISVRDLPRGGPIRQVAARGSRLLTGGFELPDLLRNRTERRAADVVLCWDERAGAYAATRSRIHGEPPVATGVVWLTDFGGRGLGRRAPAVRALASADCIYVNAPAQLDVLARWGVPEDRRHFLFMAVDQEFWGAASSRPEPGLVVGAGNDRHRDHRLLVEAIRRLHMRRPTTRLELATHHQVEVPANLGIRHPQLNHCGMRTLYARATAVALCVTPNLHLSGLTVVLEAMAAGRPVVVTEMPGIRDYVVDGETGFLVNRDPEAIADALELLLVDSDRASTMGRAGRERLDQNFTTQHLAEGLAGLIHTIGK